MTSSASIRDHSDSPGPEAAPPTPPRRTYQLDTRVLTVFFFVAMPFVAFGAFVVVNMARGLLQESIAVSLEQRAFESKQQLERYVVDQFIHLTLIAQDPQIRQALTAAKPSTREDALKLDQAWASGDTSVSAGVVSSPLATRLRDLAIVQPAMRLLQVVDVSGRLVASTARGGRLWNADTAWFRALSPESMDARPYYCDVLRLPGSPTPLLEIVAPVKVDGLWAGALRALIDTSDLHSVLAPVRVGRTGHATLVRAADGVILASGEGQRALKERYAGFDSVRAAMEMRRGYWTIPGGGRAGRQDEEPSRLVGYSLVEQVPGAEWLVVVEQDLSEATAPIEGVTRYLWLHFVGAFGTVVLLALYFSFKLDTPIIEEGLHLHEQHVPESLRKVS